MRVAIVASLMAIGCYSEAKFVPEKTDTFCSWLLECTDPAVLAFDGMDMQVCQGLWGPVFADEGVECRKFKRGLAKECVAALETQACPDDGSPVSENIPEVCDFVYERCPPVPNATDEPVTEEPDTDEPAATDVPA